MWIIFVALGLLLIAPAHGQSAEKQPQLGELEIRIQAVARETTKQRDSIEIKVVTTNKSPNSLFIEVCCGWKGIPDRLHNPVVQQLDPKGHWIFVGGAYQDMPGGLRELKPGESFHSLVYVVHPCNALTLHCRMTDKYPFDIPVHGVHRIVLRYFHSREDFQDLRHSRSGHRPLYANSHAFEIAEPPQL